jgi:hypothetical protein
MPSGASYRVRSGSGPPDFCSCTLKVPMSAVGCSGRPPEPARPMSQLGRDQTLRRRHAPQRVKIFTAASWVGLCSRHPCASSKRALLGGRPALPRRGLRPRRPPGHFRDTDCRPCLLTIGIIGVPYRIRTGVAAVRGRCPGPLDEGDETVRRYYQLVLPRSSETAADRA